MITAAQAIARYREFIGSTDSEWLEFVELVGSGSPFSQALICILLSEISTGGGGTGGGGSGASQSEVQTAVTNAINAAADIDTLISSLASLVSGQSTGNGSLASILTSLNSNNTLTTTTNTNIGAPNAAVATSSTGSFSVIGFIKRFLSRYFAPRTTVTGVVSASGATTIIPAPAAGRRHVITFLEIQKAEDTATPADVVVQSGATPILSLRVTADGTGISQFFGAADGIRGTDAGAIALNLSAAVSHVYTISYYSELITTGLPV